MRVHALPLGLALLALACSTEPGAHSSPQTGATDACSEGAPICEGNAVRSCVRDVSGVTALAPPEDCGADRVCREGVCQEPSAGQRRQAASLATFIESAAAKTAWHQPVDVARVTAEARRTVFLGDESERTFAGAAWNALNAFPQGHQSLYDRGDLCGAAVPYQNTTRYGACGRPAKDGVIVTHAREGNALGLRAGDTVVKAGSVEGAALPGWAYAEPSCGNVFPSEEGRRAAGAASFFGVVQEGTVLTVRDPSGATREVTVPRPAARGVSSCTDPFERSPSVYAEATVRPDGVAVIRMPSFAPFDRPVPADPLQFDAFIEAYQAEVVKVFDTVKSAPALVWDMRGNLGGITRVALAIVGGMPGVNAQAVSYCRTRIAGSEPIAYEESRYAEYSVGTNGPFTYSGKVAVVVDGLAYSAGDYFPYATRKATGTFLVGTASAGAFGGGALEVPIAGPPSLTASLDVTQCFDAKTDAPLEGAPAGPTHPAEYDPTDLAEGRDTWIEKAAALVRP